MTILSERKREEGIDYRFRDDLNHDPKQTCPIELIESGLIVRIGEVAIGFDNEEHPEISFRYNLMDNPNNVEINDDITILIGDILTTFIIQKLEIEQENEHRKNNPVKPNTE